MAGEGFGPLIRSSRQGNTRRVRSRARTYSGHPRHVRFRAGGERALVGAYLLAGQLAMHNTHHEAAFMALSSSSGFWHRSWGVVAECHRGNSMGWVSP